jgi:hypothetical protein
LHHRPATGEPIRLGVVSSFFYRHSNREIPLKVGRANSIASAACHLDAIRDEQTEAAATLYDRFIRPRSRNGFGRFPRKGSTRLIDQGPWPRYISPI